MKAVFRLCFSYRMNSENKKKLYWQPAVEIFSRVSTWIVVPIVLALMIGKALDNHYGTRPIIFLILAGIGFLFSCFGIVRVVKNYIKKLKEIAPPSPEASIEEGKK